MGVPQAMEAVAARAASIRESLQKSQTVTDNMVAILGSFDHRLSALETAMRPTQVHHSLSLSLCLLLCCFNLGFFVVFMVIVDGR